MTVKLVEASLPKGALLASQRSVISSAWGSIWQVRTRPHLVGTQQTALFQHLQMLQKGRQRHVEGSRQFAHRCRSTAQPFHDKPPGRVCQGVEDFIKMVGLVRHVANYSTGK